MTRLGSKIGDMRVCDIVFVYLNLCQVAFLVHGNAPEREGSSVRATHRITSLYITSSAF
jgi:hypothetical protein